MIKSKEKASDSSDNVFKVLLGLNVITIFSLIFANDNILRIIYYILYILNFILFAVVASKYKNEYKNSTLVVLILVIITSFFSFIFTIGEININLAYFSKLLNFICMLNAVFIGSIIKINQNTIKLMFYSNLAISILFIYLSITNRSMSFGGLDLGFSNPNTAGIFLFLNVVILRISYHYFKNKAKILGFGIFAIIFYLTYICYQTNSRSAFFSIIFVMLFSIFKTRLAINKLTIILVVLVPIAFVFLYTTAYSQGLFLDFQIFGKPIYSGREAYWLSIMDETWFQNIYLGNYNKWSYGNMHNAFFDIISSFGIIVLIFYIIFIYKNLIPMINLKKINKSAYISILGIAAVYIQSAAESALITGGYSLFVFIIMIFALIRNNEEILTG